MAQKEIGRNDHVFFYRLAAVSTRCMVWNRCQLIFPNFNLTIITMHQRFQSYFIFSHDIKHRHEKSYHLYGYLLSENIGKLFKGISASESPLKKPLSPGNRYIPRPLFSGPHITVTPDPPGKPFPRRAACPGICVS